MPKITAEFLWRHHRSALGGRSAVTGAELPQTLERVPARGEGVPLRDGRGRGATLWRGGSARARRSERRGGGTRAPRYRPRFGIVIPVEMRGRTDDERLALAAANGHAPAAEDRAAQAWTVIACGLLALLVVLMLAR